MDFKLEDYKEEQDFIMNNPSMPTLKLMRKYAEQYHSEQLLLSNVSQQRELLIAFLEMNNWLSLEDEENAKGVVDCYLKAINCG